MNSLAENLSVGFGQSVRHAGQIFRGVNVADEAFRRFDFVGDRDPSNPEASEAAKDRYGLQSAPGMRHSMRND